MFQSRFFGLDNDFDSDESTKGYIQTVTVEFIEGSTKSSEILREPRGGAQAVYTGDREFGRRLSLYRLKF